jgi:ATP-dependent DNA ligase
MSLPGIKLSQLMLCLWHSIKCYLQIGTGFSDEDLQKHTEFFKQHRIPQPRPYYRYDSQHEPDHWFDAVQVWEVKCADLSLSPVHRAAVGIVSIILIYERLTHIYFITT